MNIQPIDMIHEYAFWEDGCRTLALNICQVLRLAGEPVSLGNIIAFAESLPMYKADMLFPEWQAAYCSRCLEKVHGIDRIKHKPLLDYFIQYFPERESTAKRMLIESFRGILTGIEPRKVK